MKIRFLLMIFACMGLAACSATGGQTGGALPTLAGTAAGLNGFLSATKPAGQTDLIGQTATVHPSGAAGQSTVTPQAVANAPAATATTAPVTEAASTMTAAPLMASTPTATIQIPTVTPAELDTPEPTDTVAAAAASPTTQTAAIPATGGQTISLDQLLDYHVVDSSGAPLGDVKDAVISAGGNNALGQIPYLIVDSAAREDWYVPVPWQNVQVRPDTMTVMLPVTAAQFASAPGFNKDVWPTSFTNQSALQSFWANPGQAMAGQAVTLGSTGAQAVDYLRAKNLTGLKVVSPQGVKLGKIEDVAINWQNQANAAAAQFGYVVMQLDDSISPAEAMVPLPWRLIQVASGQETLALNIPPAVLQAAPNFMKGAMPNLYGEPLNGTLQQFWTGK